MSHIRQMVEAQEQQLSRFRRSVTDHLDRLEARAARCRDRGEDACAHGIEEAVRYFRHRVLGDGTGCVLTPLDPRRPEMEAATVVAGARAKLLPPRRSTPPTPHGKPEQEVLPL